MEGFAIKLGIVIQARMGSSRLPGKVLKEIGGIPLLGHVLSRLEHLHHQADIVVATSDLDQDDAIAQFCRDHGVLCFRGSERNVLQRYYQCAVEYGFDQVVRLTADNPFTDIEELNGLIQMHLDSDADFSHSFASLPVGVGAEVFTFQTLRRSYENGHEPHHIEHVDEYMLELPEIFDTQIYQAPSSKRFPNIRLTVDTQEDYEKACAIIEASGTNFPTTQQAIEFCLRSA